LSPLSVRRLSSVRPSVRPLTFHILINSSEATGQFELILTYTKAAMNNQNFIPLFSIFSLAAILVRGQDHQTQIWFSGFRGEDLNVIFYQNMPNLHNRYKSAEVV
jgi:hypothetical protein